MAPVPGVQRSSAWCPHGGVSCVSAKGASLSNCDNPNSSITFTFVSGSRSGASSWKGHVEELGPTPLEVPAYKVTLTWACGGDGWITSSKTPTRQPQRPTIWRSLHCSFCNLNPIQYGDYVTLRNHIILQLLTSKVVHRTLSLLGSPTGTVKALPISFTDLRTSQP
jgi:hypothetical protein